MFIYIDESGSFVYPKDGTRSYVCTGALTIPDRFHGKALKSFKELKRNWACENQEPKGSHLSEYQMAEVIDLLRRCQAKFHVCATNMAYNTRDAVVARKMEQADRLLANITTQHMPSLVEHVKDRRRKMKALSNQLFVQFCMMTELVTCHLQDTLVHYALADPAELARFRWNVDQKDKTKTAYEDIWYALLPGLVQSRQFSEDPRDRILLVSEGDYSYFERFCKVVDEWPDHLPTYRPGIREARDIRVFEIGRILHDSFTFEDSARSLGLQLSDIVTNAFRRAISGRLQYDGWRDLGRLMFRRNGIRLVHYGGVNARSIPLEDDLCTEVVMQMTSVAEGLLGVTAKRK